MLIDVCLDSDTLPYTKQANVLAILRKQAFENFRGKGESTSYQYHLLFP